MTVSGFSAYFFYNDLMFLVCSVADLGDRDFLCEVLHCVVTSVLFGWGLICVIVLPVSFPRSSFFAYLLRLFQGCF
jgi:hypothetical protein